MSGVHEGVYARRVSVVQEQEKPRGLQEQVDDGLILA